jgi:hypothetical protein
MYPTEGIRLELWQMMLATVAVFVTTMLVVTMLKTIGIPSDDRRPAEQGMLEINARLYLYNQESEHTAQQDSAYAEDIEQLKKMSKYNEIYKGVKDDR